MGTIGTSRPELAPFPLQQLSEAATGALGWEISAQAAMLT
jgi:hypothetical protein